MITSKIIKDSLNSDTNDRLTTFLVTFPRFVNSEILRHRAFNFCSASSRAIPSKRIIQAVMDDPALPVFWGKNQSGMQSYEELGAQDIEKARDIWLQARDESVKFVERLQEIGLHKQIANRILEPWFNITLLIGGTEWENFFALRAHEAAQPEIRELAYLMLKQYNESCPALRSVVPVIFPEKGDSPEDFLMRNFPLDWHMPFSEKMPEGLTEFERIKISCARCARLSYETFDGEINVEKDFAIFDKLLGSSPIHASPAEFIAFPINESKNVGNLKGWYQFRKLLPNETSSDKRVTKHVFRGI